LSENKHASITERSELIDTDENKHASITERSELIDTDENKHASIKNFGYFRNINQ